MRFLLLIAFCWCNFIFAAERNDDELIPESPALSAWQYPQKSLRTAEDPRQIIVCGKKLIMSGARTPHLIIYVTAAFGHNIAGEFGIAKHAFTFNTRTRITAIMLHEDESGDNGEKRLLVSAHGDLSHINLILTLLFARLSDSEFVYTGNPGNQFTKTMQALGFKPQIQYGVNPHTGEMIYIRASSNELAEQQVITVTNSSGESLQGTVEELCRKKNNAQINYNGFTRTCPSWNTSSA